MRPRQRRALGNDNLGAGLGGFDGGRQSGHPRTDDRIGAATSGERRRRAQVIVSHGVYSRPVPTPGRAAQSGRIGGCALRVSPIRIPFKVNERRVDGQDGCTRSR
jgi:hypothetical protein